MSGHARGFRLLPIATLLCVGSCLSTEGYYRYQDAGAAGAAGSGGSSGSTGSGGSSVAGTTGRGGSGVAGSTGSGGSTGGSAGTIATGRGGTTGAAGAAGGRGGTTGTAGTTGRGGTTGTAGTTGSGGSSGTTGSGGSGTILFMDDFESGLAKWDFGAIPTTMTPVLMDGTKVLNMMDTAGNQAIGAAGVATWTNYSVEARVKVLSTSGTSSSDGVAICARLTGPSSFYYLLLTTGSTTKALKIKLNNGNNTSLSSSLDSTPFAISPLPTDWVTLRLDVQGNVLTAYLNGTMRGTYTVTDSAQMLPMGGIGLMVQNVSAEFDDVVVRALP